MGYEYAGIAYERQGEMLAARRRHYVELVLAGMGCAEAARAVGVSKRTGKVWRNGRTRSTGRNEAPCAEWTEAAMPQPKPTGPRYLGTDERIFIADGLVCGLSMSAIASRLGRSRSTVCREVARNRDLNLNLNLNPPRIRCRLGFHFDMMSGGLGASLPKHSVGFKKYVAEFYCFTEGAVCL